MSGAVILLDECSGRSDAAKASESRQVREEAAVRTILRVPSVNRPGHSLFLRVMRAIFGLVFPERPNTRLG